MREQPFHAPHIEPGSSDASVHTCVVRSQPDADNSLSMQCELSHPFSPLSADVSLFGNGSGSPRDFGHAESHRLKSQRADGQLDNFFASNEVVSTVHMPSNVQGSLGVAHDVNVDASVVGRDQCSFTCAINSSSSLSHM